MTKIKVSFVSIVAVVVIFTFVEYAKSGASCLELFNELPEDKVAGRGVIYAPIFSQDQVLLSSFKFAEGPSPQRNMSIPPEPKDQYVYHIEAATEIFAQKEKLTRLNPTKVIQYLEGHEQDAINAAREQFDRMLKEFGEFYPEIFEVKNESLRNKITGDKVTRKQVRAIKDPWTAIETVGKFMQEDMLFMKKDDKTGEHVLIGGYLAFPTHWSLETAIGWNLTQIHQNIPGTPESRAKFISMISMVLDRSMAAPDRVVVRNNYFLESDPRYAIPSYIRSKSPVENAVVEVLLSGKNIEALKDLICLRIERQSIRALPESKVVVFTINPNVYQLKTVLENPAVVASLRAGLELKYPGATADQLTKMVMQILDGALTQITSETAAPLSTQTPATQTPD